MVWAERLLGFICGWGWITGRLPLGWEPPEQRVHRGLPVPLASLWPAPSCIRQAHWDQLTLRGELLYSAAKARISINNIRAAETLTCWLFTCALLSCTTELNAMTWWFLIEWFLVSFFCCTVANLYSLNILQITAEHRVQWKILAQHICILLRIVIHCRVVYGLLESWILYNRFLELVGFFKRCLS